jgi:hypothetical protein
MVRSWETEDFGREEGGRGELIDTTPVVKGNCC